jgi:hypothetical protein
VIVHNSTDDAIKNGMDEMVLIDWSEYKDEHELIIPLDERGEKVEKFRIPIIYALDGEILDYLKANTKKT